MFTFPESDVRKLAALIADNEFFVLICHTNPDGDAMGSTLGFADWLRGQGKTAVVVVPDMYPDFLNWLPGAQESIRADKYPDKAALTVAAADVVFCMDFNTPSRTNGLEQSIREAKGHRVLIDHHLDPEADIFAVSFSQPEASSTCELVYTLIEAMHGDEYLTKSGAQSLYCGMMTDTGAFTFNSNRPDIFYIISRLLERGIDKDDIYRRVFFNYSEGRLRMMGYTLYQKMRLFPEQKASLITLTKAEMKRFRFHKGDTEGFVNLPLQIRNVRFSAFLREDTEKDEIHASFRSVGTFPCNRFASTYWEGGGHLNASGGRFHGTLDEAIAHFEKALAEFK